MTKVRSIALAAFASVALFAISAQAKEIVKVDVPFDFVAGGKAFPAGRYVIAVPSDLGLLEITPEGTGKTVFLSSDGMDKGKGEFKLVFDRDGDQHILNAVATDTGVHHLVERRARQVVAHTNTGAGGSTTGSSGHR